jgi:hypothetical protein
MNREIRNQLNNLKIHLDRVDDWLRQITFMVYQIEESINQIEDRSDPCKKYMDQGMVEFLRSATTKFECPPRPLESRRSEEHTAAAGFYQS